MRSAVPVLTAVPLAACQIVGGADYLDARDQSTVSVVWNPRGTDFLIECRDAPSNLRPIVAPPYEALRPLAGAVLTERQYRRSEFFECGDAEAPQPETEALQ